MKIIDAIRLLQKRNQLRQAVLVCGITCNANRLQEIRNDLATSRYIQGTDYIIGRKGNVRTNYVYIQLKEFINADDIASEAEICNQILNRFGCAIVFNMYLDINISKHVCMYEKAAETLLIYYTKDVASNAK